MEKTWIEPNDPVNKKRLHNLLGQLEDVDYSNLGEWIFDEENKEKWKWDEKIPIIILLSDDIEEYIVKDVVFWNKVISNLYGI